MKCSSQSWVGRMISSDLDLIKGKLLLNCFHDVLHKLPENLPVFCTPAWKEELGIHMTEYCAPRPLKRVKNGECTHVAGRECCRAVAGAPDRTRVGDISRNASFQWLNSVRQRQSTYIDPVCLITLVLHARRIAPVIALTCYVRQPTRSCSHYAAVYYTAGSVNLKSLCVGLA